MALMTLEEAIRATSAPEKELGTLTPGPEIRPGNTHPLSGCVRIDGKGKESVYVCGSANAVPSNDDSKVLESLLLPYDRSYESNTCVQIPVPKGPGNLEIHACGSSKDAIHDAVFKLAKDTVPTGVGSMFVGRQMSNVNSAVHNVASEVRRASMLGHEPRAGEVGQSREITGHASSLRN